MADQLQIPFGIYHFSWHDAIFSAVKYQSNERGNQYETAVVYWQYLLFDLLKSRIQADVLISFYRINIFKMGVKHELEMQVYFILRFKFCLRRWV